MSGRDEMVDIKTEAQSHNKRGTIKIPQFSKALGEEHRGPTFFNNYLQW